ncbi:MAG: aspartate 1-decarboxylase [Spirochaetota bacterium]|jgi:aspartate 1-decarboxylase|nr:aspartate 1-decarboxylase [Spirochaetota bacterium]
MLYPMLQAKIHRAAVTDANLQYEGSITIDEDLLEAAGIREFQQVQVVDINNGARFETYAIRAPKGSGTICINGAAARLVQTGDLVIIFAYCLFGEDELARYQPRMVFVDEKNHKRDGARQNP